MGILSDGMRRLVREQHLGFVATVCPDGHPEGRRRQRGE
jgi:hypothetical protein